ncbi:MAG: GNAT family N-acetyltransferase [Phycisphaerae bacterium]|nr:GNAT family N-acetyltransferase [Phycisphaerae bacterium]
MEIRILEESQIDPMTDAAVRGVLAECFPHYSRLFSTSRHWRGNVPLFTAIAVDKSSVVACSVVIDRTIRIGARPVRVAGVGNVCALPAYRGKGIVDRILLAAMEVAAEQGFEWGMLFCRPEILKVYERTGWQPCMDRRFVRTDSVTGKSVEMPADHGKMFLRIGYRPLPAGDIDLQGDKW